VGDRFFDASLYRADPSPLALESGTVYEAVRTGDPVGLFTVTQSQTIGGVWVGLGQWRPKSLLEAAVKVAVAAPPSDDSDGPPILRKPKPAGEQTSSAPVSPVPTPSPAPGGSSAGAKPAVPASPLHTASSAAEDDPARPILRRGKPVKSEASDELAPLITDKPGAAHSTTEAAANAKGGSPAGLEVLTAVSDANGPAFRPFVMKVSPEDRTRYESLMRQTAASALGKYGATHKQHKPAAAATMSDIQFQVYDAHNNDEPVLVFSATVPEVLPTGAQSGFRYFVTVVARIDFYGDLHQLFAQVTDSTHLDAYPRLELVDVVDAEGSGTGQLLFREISDSGYDYVLYRVGADKLWPLFQGAGSNF
jgi:hypothetical protein